MKRRSILGTDGLCPRTVCYRPDMAPADQKEGEAGSAVGASLLSLLRSL